jgi:hypothetical protein
MRYFFHLAGELPARDLLGQECANDQEARDRGNSLANRIAADKPGVVEGNFISVTDERGNEIFQIPLT